MEQQRRQGHLQQKRKEEKKSVSNKKYLKLNRAGGAEKSYRSQKQMTYSIIGKRRLLGEMLLFPCNTHAKLCKTTRKQNSQVCKTIRLEI